MLIVGLEVVFRSSFGRRSQCSIVLLDEFLLLSVRLAAKVAVWRIPLRACLAACCSAYTTTTTKYDYYYYYYYYY